MMKRVTAWSALAALLPAFLMLALGCQQTQANGQATQGQPTALAPRGAQRIVPGLPSYNPTWYSRTDVWWDPSALTTGTSDDTTCLDATHQCLTFGQILLRYGSNSPQMPCGQSIVVHKTSTQTLAQQIADPVWFNPKMCDGQAQLIDTPVLLDGGADVTVGTVTPKKPDAGTPAGGQLLQVAGLPTSVVAGMFICDVTHGNSCAFVDSMADAGVAIMGQPHTAASFVMPDSGLPAPTEVNSWTTGDTVNVFTENQTGLKSWNPFGTDTTDAGMFSGGWVAFTEFAAESTSAPGSVYPWVAAGVTGIAGCKIGPRLQISATLGRGAVAYDVSNYHVGTVVVNQSTSAGPEFFGGSFTNSLTLSGLTELANDPIIRGATSLTLDNGGVFLAAPGAYLAGTLQVGSSGFPGFFKIGQAGALLYGPGGVSVKTASTFNAGGLWPNFLMTGANTLETASTGCVMTGLDAGVVTCNIPLTTANFTAQHTLKNFNNGATFTDTTP